MCNNGNGNCLAETLEKILFLQQQQENGTMLGCEKPFLGNITTTANTRPINLYSCCTNTIWTMPYSYNGATGTSTAFRIESINENTATFRILIPGDNNTYTTTDNFFTINLDNISSIKCLDDVLVANV